MSVCVVALLGSWMYICRILRKISNFVIAKLAENFGISNLDQASCQDGRIKTRRELTLLIMFSITALRTNIRLKFHCLDMPMNHMILLIQGLFQLAEWIHWKYTNNFQKHRQPDMR